MLVTQINHYLPPCCYRPLLATLIPVITQIAYRWVRHNMYRVMTEPKHFQEGKLMKQRDDQHRGFIILATTETIAFLILSKFNRFYLVPAGYTLTHLLWTYLSKRNEFMILDNGRLGTNKPIHYSSMDGIR